MELRHVRSFLVLADSRDFGSAAQQCNVTRPALTRGIHRLEITLGGSLFRQKDGGVELTDLGRRFLPMLRQIHDAAEAARSTGDEFHKAAQS